MPVPYPELVAIRLGFGLSPIMSPPADSAVVLADVAATAALPPSITTARAQELQQELTRLTKEIGRGEDDAQLKAARRDMADRRNLFLRTRLAACAGAPVGFGERLVQFWADHFTIASHSIGMAPMAAAYIDDAIRPNIGGTFLDLFTAAETHPAMLTYLDQDKSVGDRSAVALHSKKPVGVNENLAREMLELHSLGVGAGYTQQDVRELANLLTGLSYQQGTPDQRFFDRRAQPGAETVLGRSYGGTRRGGMDAILAVFRDLCNRPETARFVARKLAAHFITDEPDDRLVADLAAAWGQDGDLPALYAVLVDHPQLAIHFRTKVRQPFDYMAAGLRALGLEGPAIMAIPDQKARRWFNRPLSVMGQSWFNPSGPDGWTERSEAWINPQLLAERIDWAMSAPRALRDPLPDPRGFLQAALGTTASPVLAQSVPRAESARDGLGVVLASNDFNRR